jgi:hypothetical protein
MSCNRELVLRINRRPKLPIQDMDDDRVSDDAGGYSFLVEGTTHVSGAGWDGC